MLEFKTTTTDTYSYFDFKKNVVFTNAHSLHDAGRLWIRRVMRMEENAPIIKEDGKLATRQTLQNWINDYGITVLENMDNDTNYTIVSVEDAADHLINTYGRLLVNRTQINHSLFLKLILSICEEFGMVDYNAAK